MATQRRFAVLGENTFKIANKILLNQRVCRLLKYNCRDPFSDKLEDIDGADLLGKQISITPKIFEPCFLALLATECIVPTQLPPYTKAKFDFANNSPSNSASL